MVEIICIREQTRPLDFRTGYTIGEGAVSGPRTRIFTREDRNLPELWNCTTRDALFSGQGSWEKNREDVFTLAGDRVVR